MAEPLTAKQVIDRLQHGEVLLDTRTPAEYDHAHIPGAQSFPLMTNEERVIIGTLYKQKGREAAVAKGFELIGPRFSGFITQAEKIAPDRKLILYCWRGGLRSSVMSWVLATAGFKVSILKGGYKAYRQWAFDVFGMHKNIVVVGGKTGTGKTALLQYMTAINHYVIDLEKLASHRGSAFGSLGLQQQPSNEQFENLLAMKWYLAPDDRPVWIENESLKIGSCILPKAIYHLMRNALCFELILPLHKRIQNILKEYGHYDKQELAHRTSNLKKKLGGLRLKNALLALEENRMEEWCAILLEYYDKAYQFGCDQREVNKVIPVETDHLDENQIALLLINKYVIIKPCQI